jgi:excisionase family DNA binding protein
MARPQLSLNNAGAAPTLRARPRLTRDEVLDAREVADLLHIPASTVLDFARRDILPAHKLGRRWIFLRDEIEACVRHAPSRSHTVPNAQPPGGTPRGSTGNRPKRYPVAVPSRRPGEPPTLFD